MEEPCDVENVGRLEELAAPYLIWNKAGFDVTVASVKGGKIPLDPTSMQSENTAGYGDEFLKNGAPLLVHSSSRGMLRIDCKLGVATLIINNCRLSASST